jgi:hypothetical protein
LPHLRQPLRVLAGRTCSLQQPATATFSPGSGFNCTWTFSSEATATARPLRMAPPPAHPFFSCCLCGNLSAGRTRTLRRPAPCSRAAVVPGTNIGRNGSFSSKELHIVASSRTEARPD